LIMRQMSRKSKWDCQPTSLEILVLVGKKDIEPYRLCADVNGFRTCSLSSVWYNSLMKRIFFFKMFTFWWPLQYTKVCNTSFSCVTSDISYM